MLRVIEALTEHQHTVDIVPTFLGAHAVPPEYKNRADDYAELVAQEMLAQAAKWVPALGLRRAGTGRIQRRCVL